MEAALDRVEDLLNVTLSMPGEGVHAGDDRILGEDPANAVSGGGADASAGVADAGVGAAAAEPVAGGADEQPPPAAETALDGVEELLNVTLNVTDAGDIDGRAYDSVDDNKLNAIAEDAERTTPSRAMRRLQTARGRSIPMPTTVLIPMPEPTPMTMPMQMTAKSPTTATMKMTAKRS